MKQGLIATGIFLLAMISVAAPAKQLCRGFLPENDRWIGVDEINASTISKNQFNATLDRLQKLYEREISDQGAFLKIERFWSDGTVNAYASQDGRTWRVAMYGGMARHPALTPDGFAFIACHELGHHLGGAPRLRGTDDDWASVEGESDYYGGLKCMRRYFSGQDNAGAVAKMSVDAEATRRCARNHSSREAQLVCIRTSMAGLSLGAVLADITNGQKTFLRTPDPSRVSQVYESHPKAQCRVDTYFQSALCPVPVSQSRSPIDYRPGSCTDATKYRDGLRPRCWFAP